jgi:hypothetical protein
LLGACRIVLEPSPGQFRAGQLQQLDHQPWSSMQCFWL